MDAIVARTMQADLAGFRMFVVLWRASRNHPRPGDLYCHYTRVLAATFVLSTENARGSFSLSFVILAVLVSFLSQAQKK